MEASEATCEYCVMAAELIDLTSGPRGGDAGALMKDAMNSRTDGEDPRMWKMTYLLLLLSHIPPIDPAFEVELRKWSELAKHVVEMLEAKEMGQGGGEAVH